MGEMEINIRNTMMVRASQETPKKSLWLSNLDLVAPREYIQTIYFYKSNGSPGFFDPNLVREALSRTLISYYPMAGRLRRDNDGRRIEIDCNNEGVSFVEAETTSVLDHFNDFAPNIEEKKLVPSIDSSSEVSSNPLLLAQLTYFKCGGVSLGLAIHHILADGFSLICIINSWASLARGVDPTTRPSVDRTVLHARDPPSPKFQHMEYEPCPTLLTPRPTTLTLSTRTFNITRDQINALNANSKENSSSFEILSGHIWRCVCKARALSDAQPSKLYIPVDGRSRLKPSLSPMYFGNPIFLATPMASAGEIVPNPASYAASKIREAVARMDDEYLKSALDYIEVQPDQEALARGPHLFKSPNLYISSIAKLPIYGAEFGWGRPAFIRRVWVQNDGVCSLAPMAGSSDGGLYLLITLEEEHMQLFETYLYDN